MATDSSILAWRISCQRSLVSYNPGVAESDTTERLHFHLLQYSVLENSMDYIVHGVAESDTTE